MKIYFSHGIYLITLVILGTQIHKDIKSENQESFQNKIETTEKHTTEQNQHLSDLTRQLVEVNANVIDLRANMEQQINKMKKQIATISTVEYLAKEDANPQEPVYDDALEEYAQEDAAIQWYHEQETAIENLMDNDGLSMNVTEFTSTRIQQAISTHGYSISLNTTSCSESACKVEAKYDTNSSTIPPNIDELVYSNLQWDGPILSNVNEETGDITLYMLMPGETAGDLGVEG